MQIAALMGLIWNLGLLLQGFIALFYLRKLKNSVDERRDNFIHIVIAVKNEELTHLDECLEYFLSHKEISKLTICLTGIDNDYQTYCSLIKSFMASDSRLSYVVYDGKQGYKAEQVNVALNQIVESGEDVLVGIYDIDSRPDRKVFGYVKRNKIDVGQQPILYDTNLDDLSLLSLAGALHQTAWAIGFEMFNLLFSKGRLVYTVGHGLFLSSDALRYCGVFDEKAITEDAMYGYKASVAKRDFRIIPYCEHAKFAKSLRSFVPQCARWYTGELELLDRFWGWFDRFDGKLSDRRHYYLRLVELIWWPLERIFYIATIAGAMIGLIKFEILVMYAMTIVLSGWVSVIFMIKNGSWDTRLLIAPVFLPIWHGVSVLGPLLAITKRISGSGIRWTITKK